MVENRAINLRKANIREPELMNECIHTLEMTTTKFVYNLIFRYVFKTVKIPILENTIDSLIFDISFCSVIRELHTMWTASIETMLWLCVCVCVNWTAPNEHQTTQVGDTAKENIHTRQQRLN